MLNYIKSDRTQLPPDGKELVEAEIRKFGLDCGFTSPDELTSKLARKLQSIFDSEPDMSGAVSDDALKAWRKHGPIKLSQLALNSAQLHPLDLDDTKYKIMSVTCEDGSKHWRVVSRSDGDP